MTRPAPVPDESSAEYWAAAARHELVIPRCARCDAYSLPPEAICHHCGSTTPDFRFERVSGDGTIRSWTTVHRATLTGFAAEVPYLLVDVELAEQRNLRMLGRLLDGPNSVVHQGDSVHVAFEDIAADVAVPAFVLAAGPELR
ncbi:Zn-ribbon domain-containing OB-fold protein [Nocardia vaccinii]|uniref:Zn-ribbon domain-containing OB-fold protein n=1 Tax=Nocardia vaccinii TaxID=1822 RepID=UPI000835E06A|nr:OB-fold domain-containing protein [Nocardia vaccinii]